MCPVWHVVAPPEVQAEYSMPPHHCWQKKPLPRCPTRAHSSDIMVENLTFRSIPPNTAAFVETASISLDIDRSHRCCVRPLWGTSRSCSRPRHEPGRPRREEESARTLEAARSRVRSGMGQCPSTAPPSVDRRQATREALKKARTVRFDPCVRVVLVPSRRDIDRVTKHAVWWGRADVRQFRRDAYDFFQEHGTLSVVSNEELRQAGPPPGMPPPPFLRADSGDIAGGGVALPKDPSTRRRRYHRRRAPATDDRQAAFDPGSMGEPQRENGKGCKAVSEPGTEDSSGRGVAEEVVEAQKTDRRQVYCEHEARFTTVAFVIL